MLSRIKKQGWEVTDVNEQRPEEHEDQQLTIRDVLEAMRGPHYPGYLEKLLQQVQQWLTAAVSGEYPPEAEDTFWGNGDRMHFSESDALLPQLAWAQAYADILPTLGDLSGREEAVVLGVGPILFDEGLRMALDQGSLFGRGRCQRVWLVTDSWQMVDVAAYMGHLKALEDQGIELRFLFVTPWGWTEVPWGTQPGCPGRMIWKNGREKP
ncbi:conserved hypothetical protein [Aminomonas paucivorans DSM 12260]|uniref:Uncharacterized protein n=2 Tax=Aminomonas TaxID=81411 RepID=E3CUF3_9BACT|nr:conserved hypothetical protein [Aminomonas paucivorans DSM 12260]